MKIIGVSMLRNEEDIVEAFVRHNLSLLDGMIVVDHGSSDRTLAILAALCDERLRLVLLRSDAIGYLQTEITTTAVREAFERGGADAVIPLDADEFPRVPSRTALEREIVAIPAGHHGRIEWPTYIPSLDLADGDIVSSIRSSRRALPPPDFPPQISFKIVLTRSFAVNPDAMVAMGNHDVILGRHHESAPRMPHVELSPEVIAVCHVPIRSTAQFVVKIAVKRLARIAANRDYGPGAPAVQAFRALCAGAPLTRDVMFAKHAGGPDHDASEPAFVDRMTLRYTPSPIVDPLLPVITAAERLSRRLAQARAATATQGSSP